MSPYRPTTAETDLQRIADFDHPFRVTQDGRLEDGLDGVHAPSVYHDPVFDIEIEGSGWTALTGWTGQYLYSGAVMHSSEFLGGGIAHHILSTPGVYVVVAVEVHPEDALEGEDPESPEPAGWAVLKQDEK